MNMSRTTRSNSVGPGGVDNLGKLPEEEGDLREFIKNVVAASQAALMGEIAGLKNTIANLKEENELAIVTINEKSDCIDSAVCLQPQRRHILFYKERKKSVMNIYITPLGH